MMPVPAKPSVTQNGLYFIAAAQVYNAMRGCGAENPLAIAAVANADMESAFKPRVVGDQGTAYNLFQWHWTPRGARILQNTGIDVRHETSIKRVVGALWWELNNVYPTALETLKTYRTAEAAAASFCTLIEGAGAANASLRRSEDATYWVEFFSNPAYAGLVAANPAT